MTSSAQYIQVKNPSPRFTSGEKKTLPFCTKLMRRAQALTARIEFTLLIAVARRLKKRRRRPPELRCRAINALMQALCFHYDPLANRVNATMTTIAQECGLATESATGNLSICRATRALRSMADDFGLITYSTEYDPQIGCYVPSDITFTPQMLEILEISREEAEKAAAGRAEYINQRRQKEGLPRLQTDELAQQAFSYMRNAFQAYRLKRKKHGETLARGRRDSVLTKKEIEQQVRQDIIRKIKAGLFPMDLSAVRREITLRVKERLIISRACNWQRLQKQLAPG